MKRSIPLFIITVVLIACKSIPEKVKADKEKYIQVAKENSKPVDINNLTSIYEQAQSSNVEGKMKYLGVDNIQTVYAIAHDKIKLDSIVIFTKSNYLIFYDFAETPRNIEIVRQKSNLDDFEILDDRLFIGKK